MSRSNGFSMHCNLCERTFDSAAFMFLHFSEHVRKPNSQKQYEVSGLNEINSLQLCDFSCNNCSAPYHPINCNDKSGCNKQTIFKNSLKCLDSEISSTSNEESSATGHSKECDVITNMFPSTFKCTDERNNNDFSVTLPKTTNCKEVAGDESFDELDPSELCVTLIEEQAYNNNTDQSLSLPHREIHSLIAPNTNSPKLKRTYSCRICSKIFGWPTDLKRHVLVHTGERPFKCESCNASFTRNFLLQKHLSKVHPCHLSKEKLKYIEDGVELNLKLLRESFNIPKNVKSKA